MTELAVTRRVIDALVAAYDAALPAETCGLVLGARSRDRSIATDIVVARNSTSGPGGFEIADREMRRCLLHAQDRGLDVVSLFHSHTSGDSRLSDDDRLCLRHSEWPWLVVTCPGGASSAGLGLAMYGTGDASPIAVVRGM